MIREMVQWRVAHLTVTLLEIEQEVGARLAGIQALLVEAALQRSRQADPAPADQMHPGPPGKADFRRLPAV